ncbi:protein-glutamine gamma-glutamyltransferase [Bacillus suaedaesalsae]|uniref:Protein-glutamine gamma-glutamyltransferase n=1 Tax=Bacillus suaedaesalsae TaxID=2810349 RepID=A0ABS2DHA0_9BACI|nr:protein-glutamine gamma-glutamyltransferase [Bacillus suaedaesalsae]MBM6617845.1 protein-glutamine gamma-glutamyltransferase [Bacillus suaedaesalsae]
MIQVAGMPFQPIDMNVGSMEEEILKKMSESQLLYSFTSNRDLLFDLTLRRNIIDSANEMNNSKAAFTTFQYSQCNVTYWNLTNTGGFLLKPYVRPSEAIMDINQNSSLYAFECATACMIVFYQAVLKSIGVLHFDSLFQNMYLYSWNGDADLGINTSHANHFLPGDVVYFDNPDFHPNTPWYRGVNAVAMSNGKFFGHGFGILTAEELLSFLNSFRLPASLRPAYLTSLVTKISLLDKF